MVSEGSHVFNGNRVPLGLVRMLGCYFGCVLVNVLNESIDSKKTTAYFKGAMKQVVPCTVCH